MTGSSQPDPFARQKRYRQRIKAKADAASRMADALRTIEADLADTQTEKGKRLLAVAREGLE